MLSTGIPVSIAKVEGELARIPQLGVRANIPRDAIGRAYEEGPLFPLPDAIAARPLDHAALRFNDDPVDMSAFTLT